MPNYCSVYGCYSSSVKNPDLSFFRYPKDVKLLNAWVCRVRRENFTPSSTSYVCSRHFLEHDMYVPDTDTPHTYKKRRLCKGAVPSVNLRGKPDDEKVGKRSTRVLNRDKRTAESADAVEVVGLDAFENAAFKPVFATPAASSCEKICNATADVEQLVQKIECLQKLTFTFSNLSDTDVKNYTGVATSIFEAIVDMIKVVSPLNYWSGKAVGTISVENQLLICLMRLRLDLPYFDLAQRFGLSQTTIQNIFMTFLHALHEIIVVGCMSSIPSQLKNKSSLPDLFGDFTNCRLIIDCTEFRIAAPRSDLLAASAVYSNYKHYLTAKFLIGVAPNGAITFVSQGFPGGTSDKVVTCESGVLSHLKVSLMAIWTLVCFAHHVSIMVLSLLMKTYLSNLKG